MRSLRLAAQYLIFISTSWLLLVGPGRAQVTPKLDPPPDSLFSPSQRPTEPDIPYQYALKSLHITFGQENNSIIAILHYQVRIKVFDASDKQVAMVGIPYYFKNNIERISDIRGATFHSADEKISLDPKSIKTININARYNVKEFTMPAVEDGSVIVYNYTIRRRYIKELPDFYLANRVPTERAEVSITYPQYLRYKGVAEHFDGHLSHFFTKKDTSTAPKVFTYPQPPPILKETWRATDVPAIMKEAYITSLDDYRGKIKFQLSEFGIPRQTLENSWAYVVADIRRKQKINAHIDNNTSAYAIGKQIAREFSSKQAVQDSIFDYVSERVNFSGSNTPFSASSDTTALKGNPADQATINQLLAAMLRGGGIDAYPMLVSTRKSGQINRSFPSFFQFNGQLVYSKIAGKSYFMDASFAHSKPNLIPVYMYNQTGLLMKSARFRWIRIKPRESIISIDVNVNAALDQAGNISGTITAKNDGYPAQKIREQYTEGASVNKIIRQALLQGYSDVAISKAELQKGDAQSEQVTVSSQFRIEDYARSFRSGLDFRPMMIGYLRQNPFNEKKRKLPVTLDAPEKLHFNYSIKVPPGMHLPDAPKNRTIAMRGARISEKYSIEGNKLNYVFDIDISRKKFPPDVFNRLMNIYKRWVQLSKTIWHLRR